MAERRSPRTAPPHNPRAREPGEVRPREAALGSWHPGQGTGQQLALWASLVCGSRRHLQCEPLGPRSLAGRLCPLSQCVLPSRCSWVSLSSLPTHPPCPTAAALEPGWTCSPRTLQPRARSAIPRLPCTHPAPHRAGSLQGEGWVRRVASGEPALLVGPEVGETIMFWPERVASWEILSLPLSALS